MKQWISRGGTKVAHGQQVGYFKDFTVREYAAYHFAEKLNLKTPAFEIGCILGRLSLISIEENTNSRDLQSVYDDKIQLGDEARAATSTLPFLWWLNCGDRNNRGNWIREEVDGVIRIVPIDFDFAFSPGRTFDYDAPEELRPDRDLMLAELLNIEHLSEADIEVPLQAFGLGTSEIEDAIWRRENLRTFIEGLFL